VLLVFSLAFSLGLHWMFLQSAAWVGMAVSYSQDSSFKEALAKTFDGRHPCKLCKFVAEAKKSEKKQETQKVETKFDLLCAAKPFSLFPPRLVPLRPSPTLVTGGRSDAPPTPPPRQLQG